MPNKCTWLFNGLSTTSGKTWGFSESWYTGLTGAALIDAMDRISNQRRRILASESTIVGYRISGGSGRAFVVRKNYPGSAGRGTGGSNLPVDSVNCSVGVSGVPNIKKFFFHDLPDTYIVDTGIDPDVNLNITAVIRSFVGEGMQVQFQRPSLGPVNVLSISNTGLVTTQAAFPVTANAPIQFLRTVDNNRRPVKGRFVAQANAVGNTFQLVAWTGQVVGNSGKVRVPGLDYAPAVYLGAPPLTTLLAAARKVGRPFFQSRGRVPARR